MKLYWTTVALALATATHTSAAIIQVTASGIVDNGVDGAGLFGGNGIDLSGRAYSVIFNIDTSKGYVIGGATADRRNYASILHSRMSTPAITGQISINGSSYFVDGSRSGVNYYSASGAEDLNSLSQDVRSRQADLVLYDGFNPIEPSFPGLSIPDMFHDPNLNPKSFSIDYSSIPFNYLQGNFVYNAIDGSTSLGLDLKVLDYNVISALGGPTGFSVPEPANWSMTIFGCGCVGAVVRRRKVAITGARQINLYNI